LFIKDAEKLDKSNDYMSQNKNVSYRKHIACHDSWSTMQNFPHIWFDHRAEFGCCFLYCVRTCRRSQKLGGHPLDGNVADTLETHYSPTCK